MAIKIDIHNAKKRTERAKINLQKKFSGDNAKIVCKFIDRLRLDNKSYGRIAAMILAVAIISVIAVSARSRLSIMPRIWTNHFFFSF